MKKKGKKVNKKAPVAAKNAAGKNVSKQKKEFPKKFPFWARLKISKKRTTLVIDEEEIVDKKSRKKEEGYVHREATHTPKKDFEKINKNKQDFQNLKLNLFLNKRNIVMDSFRLPP